MPNLTVLGIDNIKHPHELTSARQIAARVAGLSSAQSCYLCFSVDVGAEIDCLVLGPFGALIGELKHWNYPVHGHMNGRWERQSSSDQWEILHSSLTPYEQARKQRSRLGRLIEGVARDSRHPIPSSIARYIRAGIVQVPRLQLHFKAENSPWWFQDGLDAFADRVLRSCKARGPFPDALYAEVLSRLGLRREATRRKSSSARETNPNARAQESTPPRGTSQGTPRHRVIVAGPGAGKTRWMATEIVSTLRAQADAQIVALSYTTDARNELQDRFRQLVSDHGFIESRSARFLTLHQFARQMAGRSFADRRVLDEEELRSVAQLATGRPVDVSEIEQIKRAVCISNGRDIAWVSPDHASIWQRCSDYFDESGSTTFEHMLLAGVKATETPSISASHLFVDEAQDLNGLQLELLSALVTQGSRLTAIGDPGQSVFSFAGAIPEAMTSLADRLKCEPQTFDENHRSGTDIVRLLNSTRRDGVQQQPQRAFSGRVESWVLPTRRAVADFVARAAADLAGADQPTPVSLREIAVVARTKSELRDVASAFTRHGVPHSELTEVPFHERPRVRQLLRLLPLLDDHFSELEFELAIRALGGLDLADTSPSDVETGPDLPGAVDATGIKREARRRLSAARGAGPRLSDRIRAAHAIFVEPQYSLFERAPSRRRESRMDLEMLCRMADSWGHEGGALADAVRNDGAVALPAPDVVRLTTVHAAKGRAWNVVFIPNATRGKFPLGTDSDESEEQRVLYVAMSRAKDRLILCRTQAELPSPFLPAELAWRELNYGGIQPGSR